MVFNHRIAHMHAPTQMSHCSLVAYPVCLIKAELRECPHNGEEKALFSLLLGQSLSFMFMFQHVPENQASPSVLSI